MPRPRQSKVYLAADDPLAMDEAYCRRKAGDHENARPHLFRSVRSAYWYELWGEPGDEADSITFLGARGRIWALCLLLVQYGLLSKNARTAALTIWNDAGPDSAIGAKIVAALSNREKECDASKIVVYLQHLISANRKDTFPPGDTALLWVELVERYAVAHLLGTLDEQRASAVLPAFHKALVGGSTRPSEVYESLRTITSSEVDRDAVNARRRARGRSSSQR
jgi:hypothetical protein